MKKEFPAQKEIEEEIEKIIKENNMEKEVIKLGKKEKKKLEKLLSDRP